MICKKTKAFNLRKYSLIFILIILCSYKNVLAEDIKKVVVLPFEIHSQSDVVYLQNQITDNVITGLKKTAHIHVISKDILSPLIRNRQIDQKSAVQIGSKLGADFIITGSLSRLGNIISTDVTVIDIKGEKVTSGLFAQGSGMESIQGVASQLTGKILLEILRQQRVARIDFIGNTRIEDSAIYNVLTSTEGGLFLKKTLSSDIKAIYKMGYFMDVTAQVSDSPGGQIITFTLQEMPTVTEVEIKGNDDIKQEDIEDVISVQPKQILNPNKVKSDTEEIKALYHNKGYLDAKITYEVDKINEKSVRIVFNITENKRSYIESIVFKGNKTYTDDELKDMMETSEKGFFSFFTDSGLLSEDKLNQDKAKLTAFYNNNGYVNARIGQPEIKHDKKGIYIKIPVIEGIQFGVGNVEITGDIISIPPSELVRKLKVTQKDYFDRDSIIRDIDYLTEVCNNEGYAYASVSPKTMPRKKDHKIDVTYVIDKGNLVYINRILISGNTKTRDKVVRRQLEAFEGDLYNRSNLKKSYMKLARLRYFEEIDFQTGKGPAEDLIDVNIKVKEKSTGMFSIGAGYSGSDGPVFMGQISQQNLFGRGQTIKLTANIGSETNNFELSFIEPWLFDIPLWSQFELWSATHEYDSYDLDTKGIGATLGYPLWEHFKGYIGYTYRIDDVKDVTEGAALVIKDQKGLTHTSGITATLSRDTSNDIMFPSRGSKNIISVEHTGTIFQGDVSYTKYTGTTTWYFPLPLDTVFGVRGRIGYMHANEGKEIPIYKRFYLGGINSLRGLKDVGPRDPETGDEIGGTTMLNFNIEYVFPLLTDAGIKGLVFFDTGNAWEDEYRLDDMRETAGFGIRWYSPIGPIRLEWGHVLDRRDDESSSRFEFSMGMMM